MHGTGRETGFVRALKGVLLSAALIWAALFSLVSAESITSFEADYVITAKNEVAVNETIVYDFGTLQRRGIFREVLPTHPQEASTWYKERYVKIRPVAVTRNGVPERFVNEADEGLFLRIGDPNVYITGEHEYQITYIMEGALSQYDNGHTELYWNVTGSDWEIPINNVEISVASNEGVGITPEHACYTGVDGSTARCQTEFIDSYNRPQSRFTQPIVRAGEQVTIAQELEPTSPVVMYERLNWLLVLPLFVLVLATVFGVWVYRWRTHFNPRRTVIPQYEPYKHFKPMFTGVLVDNRLDSKDVTAGIVYLAEQGFISIKQLTETYLGLFEVHDYEITLKRSPSEVKTRFQTSLLKLLFFGQEDANKMERKLISFKLSSKSVTSLEKVFEHIDMEPGKVVRLSDIKKNQKKLRINHLLLKKLREDVEEDLVDHNFIEQRASRKAKGGWIAVGIFALVFGVQFAALLGPIFIAAGIGAAMLLLVFAVFAMERRTAKGYEALNHLEGFKDFLSVTEKERYAFHNAPDKSPQQFMEYLPYAIAFGVEKEWAEVFKDIQLDSPDWYQSDVPGSTFSAVALTSELSSFSGTFSSSTGSSGASGGGGSSGGGGGGGGGGSW